MNLEAQMERFHAVQSLITTNTSNTSQMQFVSTHIVIGLLVGAGIQQEPHTVRATTSGGIHQGRLPALCAHLYQCAAAATHACTHHDTRMRIRSIEMNADADANYSNKQSDTRRN